MILEWPVREGLLVYVELLKQEAGRLYYDELQLWGLGVLKEAPKRPRILDV